MAAAQPAPPAAFNILPIEINKLVLSFLDTDQDIVNFSSVCRSTYYAVNGDNNSFWRTRFREKYAYDANFSNGQMKIKYQTRTRIFKKGITMKFDREWTKSEKKLIWHLKDMINESFQGGTRMDEEDGAMRCPNQIEIIKFILSSNHFLSIKAFANRIPEGFESDIDRMLGAVRIMCAQLLIEDIGNAYDILPFEDSQCAVYAHVKAVPMFYGQYMHTINMTWILDCMNFFHHHIAKPELGTLYDAMEYFPWGDRPSAWQSRLEEGCRPLSRHWKGTYSYLNERERDHIRDPNKRRGMIFDDKHIELGPSCIQDLEFQVNDSLKFEWPQYYEERLRSLTSTLMPPVTRAQHKTYRNIDNLPTALRISGEGSDQGDEFFASGWVNALPRQGGIPGWQRITLMKHFLPLHQGEMDDLWAYEGVVLPGGRLIIGRWWFASGDLDDPHYAHNSGPFLLWAVDEVPSDTEGSEDLPTDDDGDDDDA